ncbi:unnamed protein product [Protopolystoma xenopodis]|uniref:Uncharacterized protein n=1 Tax=Protopolystoma xenopodis TaxID=117903 RepID=A0A448XAC0_9PLAT|nr:unnamed protein product [Protopolystoma xenopodis]
MGSARNSDPVEKVSQTETQANGAELSATQPFLPSVSLGWKFDLDLSLLVTD